MPRLADRHVQISWTLALSVIALLVCTQCMTPVSDGSAVSDEPKFSGDLAEIQKRGTLRILVPRRWESTHLPRRGRTLDQERDLAQLYAAELGVRARFIPVRSRDDLINALLAGHGDIIAANLTATKKRRMFVDFTVPVDVVREQIVARADDDTIASLADLAGRTIAIKRSSSFWQTVRALQSRVPEIIIETVPDDIDTEDLIDQVARGDRDLTVADSNLVQACLEFRHDIRAAIDLTENRPIAWAIRHNSPELLENLNRFLTSQQLAQRDQSLDRGDLARIRERKVLRVLTVNSATTYFLWRGRLMGFEYELMRHFAESQGLQLEMIVPEKRNDLLPMLESGRGDVVSASLAAIDDNLSAKLAFTQRYVRVKQVIVARRSEDAPRTPLDLTGRTIAVHHNSADWQTLETLRDMGIQFGLRAVPNEMPVEEIIAGVARGDFDMTMASSHIVDFELTWRDDIQKGFAVRDDIPLSWAVRADNTELMQALNEFIDSEYRGLFYNVIYERYFTSRRRIRNHLAVHQNRAGQLSPYDELVRRYAEEHGFDWRMIVALMYEESGFDPTARSFAGARGLMQVLPRTAHDLGFDDLDDPETSIQAGVEYLAWARERFEEDLHVRDRMWFTLAAYNAGPGHVRDARRLAKQMNLDPDTWFGNVEQAMLLLSRPQYAQEAAHGYCRCQEPVNYVRSIRDRYNAYTEIVAIKTVAAN